MSGDTFDFLQGNRETLTGTLHDPAATTGQVLTVQADKSIKAAAGGGSMPIHVETVRVSSAEILALHDTPVTLIPGVAGFITVPSEVAVAYIAGATPYIDNGGDIAVNLGIYNWFNFPSAGLWDQATSQFYPLFYANLGYTEVADLVGVDVVLVQDTANPTDGDGTLVVTISYFLAPVA